MTSFIGICCMQYDR